MLPIQSSREINKLKGRRINRILAEINHHMHLYGYDLIDVPIIDSADLFLVKAGDQIINSLLTFDRHGKQLALRPEFTASAADYFAKTQGNPVVRWQFSGPIFEDKAYEYSTEFEQLGIGAELIGLSGSLAEAEIIAMSARGLDKIGLQNVQITMGHIGLIREIIRQFKLDARTQRFLLHHIPAFNDPDKGTAWILEQFDNQFSALKNNATHIDEAFSIRRLGSDLIASSPNTQLTMGGRTQEDIVRRLQLKQQRFTDRNNLVAAVECLGKWCERSGEPVSMLTYLFTLLPDNNIAVQLLNEWHNVIALLEAHGIALSGITIKPDLARSWEYYTGIVFELHSDGIHLGGGGRYDALARLVGSQFDTAAVGFAYYGNRLMDALRDIPFESEPLITITCADKDLISAITWANSLRNHDISTQILPHSAPTTERKLEVKVENSTTAYFQMKEYQIEQISLLISDLKQFYQ